MWVLVIIGEDLDSWVESSVYLLIVQSVHEKILHSVYTISSCSSPGTMASWYLFQMSHFWLSLSPTINNR